MNDDDEKQAKQAKRDPNDAERRASTSLASRLKSYAILGGLVLGGVVAYRVMFTRGTMTVYHVGGTAQAPFVLASHFERSGTDSKHNPGLIESLVFVPGASGPTGSVETNANPGAYGSHGNKVWLDMHPMPLLFDAGTATVEFNSHAIADKHVPLANGFDVYRPPHGEFDGPLHLPTGALALTASNGLHYVLGLDGTLTTWDDFVARYPAPETVGCKGGRHPVCGGDGCLKLEPDPAGGETLTLPGDRASAAMFSPELLSEGGCVRRLGDDGPIVVRHQSKPGRDLAKDTYSAIAADGTTSWSVTLAELFGGRDVKSHAAAIVDDTLVVGAVVPHWWHGSTATVATVSREGKVSPASG